MKLYLEASSDTVEKVKTLGGHKFINVSILVGSAKDPEKLAELTVDYIEEKDRIIYQLWNYGNVIDSVEILKTIPCKKCGGVRDVEALICNKCKV